MSSAPSTTFRLNPLLEHFVPRPLASLIAPPLEQVLALRALEKVYAELPRTRGPLAFAQRALEVLDVRFAPEGALDDIPVTGPLVLVANHPYGGIEGLYLYSLLASLRPDVRILGNRLLGRIPEFAPTLYSVDVLAGRSATMANAAALRRAIRWVGDGGALLVFPAGEVSSLDPVTRTVVDPAWQPSVARLISLARASVVPVYVGGSNSPLFHAAGLVHPRLRTALLPRELVNKRRRTIPVRVGRVIGSHQIAAMDGDARLIEHLRLRVYSLASELPESRAEPAGDPPRRTKPAVAEPIAPAGSAALIAAEVAALPPERMLGVAGTLEVWHAPATQIPRLLQEIGRLRETTFRQAGEGTGRTRDIDLFDSYYEHLFVWNRATAEVVGAYRIGHVDRILARYGARGVYTSTLFHFHKSVLPSLGHALELGRSFVRPEYQRSFSPLLLLWKGIAGYLARHPEYRVLFGPVSISNDYTLASKALLTGFLRSRHGDARLGSMVRARHPLPNGESARLLRREAADVGTLEALEALLTSIEGDGKGVPVLLRQYLKLGARAIAFNVDPDFGHSIDVLVAVDLIETDERVLAKYMGRDAAVAYRARHGH